MKGHVYRRGKSWTYVFDGPPDPLSGERRQISKGGWPTEKRAWSECRIAMQQAEEGRFVQPSRRTLGSYLVDEWLPAVKTSASATTWGNWSEYTRAYVVPLLGKVRLQEELTAPRLQALYAHLLEQGRIKPDLSWRMFEAWSAGVVLGSEPTAAELAEASGAATSTARGALRRFRSGYKPTPKNPGLEPKTVRNIHTMLHKALADALRWRYVVENVASAAKPPKLRRRKHTIWTPDQIRQFLRASREDRFYSLYLLAATTGLRRSELCGMSWSALDLESGTLAVEPDTLVVVNGQAQASDGKTDQAPRLLALDPATVAALREQRQAQDEERAFFGRDYPDTNRVFTWEDGRSVHPDVVRQRFNRLADRCGLPHIRLHDMRHSYATAALRSGVHLKIVSARLGHASPAFTARVYQHALPEMDREAAHSVAALMVESDGNGDADGDPC